MKKTFILGLLLCSCITALCGESTTMTIMLRNGNNVTMTYDAKPFVTFMPDTITVTTNGTDKQKFCFGNVKSFVFREKGASAVDNVLPKNNVDINVKIDLACGDVAVSGLKPGSLVTIYTMNGTIARSCKCDANGNAHLSTSTLPSGVYVVRAGLVSYKMIK